MSGQPMRARANQRGLVLVSSLLLLLVVTILALAMFRSMGLAEKISGNVREKQRALHAAVVAEQYAEWWLSGSGNSPPPAVVCSATGNANLTTTQVLICNNPINPTPVTLLANPQTLPWTDGSGGNLGFTVYPNSTTSTATNMIFTADASGSYSNTYYSAPAFYIQLLGIAADHQGNVYRIDAVGYGGNSLSVAVVESTYEIGASTRCLSCL
jgi:type IV pilus assembly protein PilX